MFRPRLRIPRRRLLQLAARRSMHGVPELDPSFRANGVPGLLSPNGFDVAWTQYQGLVVDNLNTLVTGTEYEQKDVKTIAVTTARDPALAPLFNYASMAHNNHFFFDKLLASQPPSSPPTASSSSSPAPTTSSSSSTSSPHPHMPSSLRAALEASFSSLATLRREFAATALAMFGPGFVWLVRAHGLAGEPDAFRLLPTYLAGSPYPGAHARRQGVDMNTVGAGTAAGRGPVEAYLARQAAEVRPGGAVQQQQQQQQGVGALWGSGGAAAGVGGPGMTALAPGGIDLVPVLCLNTWEHVWLTDYGVGGKREYVERWWDCINWEKVAEAAKSSRRGFLR